MKFPRFHKIFLHPKSPNRQIDKSPNRPITQSSNCPIISRSPFLLVSLSLCLLFSDTLFAQNEANIWYFGTHCGLDFNTGTPVVLYDGQTNENLGNSTISDTLGNLLFYTAGHYVYNRNHNVMPNGIDLINAGTYGRAIVKWPGKENLYYIFNANHPQYYLGFYYSIVDMNLDNGLGDVTEKDIQVTAAFDAADRIAVVRQDHSDNVWVITRKSWDDEYAAFLVDQNGLNLNPVLSSLPHRIIDIGRWGYLKISYDKKYILSNYSVDAEIDVCSFNENDGTITYLYTLFQPGGVVSSLGGMEFSPDSKYLYVGYTISNDSCLIYQFDMQYINDKTMFSNSGVKVGAGGAFGMQLARDGMIYCSVSAYPDPYYHLSVIQKPWVQGSGCSYISNALYTYPGNVSWSLPNIMIDYLFRFEWEGDLCVGSPIQFKPNFIPTPDSIEWYFGEFAPGCISHELAPVYAFQNPGVHEVLVKVWYPSGRYEQTSREIIISPSPQPELGPDTLICNGASVTLNANCDADFFFWSTGQFGVSSITVSDSGTYWVRGKYSDSGCEGYDTIHIGYDPPTIIDETNLIITPTTCNGASGSVTGLNALGSAPFSYQWLDLSGNDYGTSLDLYNLPAGQYILTVTDGNGCQTSSAAYTIEDAGNLQVLDVELTQPHCGRPDGQIVVHAFSPSGSALEYSVDDGTNYSTDSIFSGLFAGVYIVRIRDINDCEGFYIDNPIMMVDIPGPQVLQVNVTNETDFLGNGAIEIIASGSTPVIYYSIDSGATWQLNDGSFYNLQSRIYSLQVKDDNGCDTTFTVEIQNIVLTFLHAVTGEGGHCLGNTALVPVNVDNFNSVAAFHLKLGYNKDNLQCEGFANVHPQLADSLTGWVDLAGGNVHLAWNGDLPLTFSQREKVADLVFTTKNPGQGQLSWYTGETESYFTNAGGNPIPAEFSTGEVTIYQPPQIILAQSKTACEGQDVYIMSIASGNQPPFDYLWIYPNGDTTANDPMYFSVSPADGGIYTLLATDKVGCTDQKSIELIVSENPVAAFHGTDTLVMSAGDMLDAGEGMATYEWSTGDTTQSIAIQAEGRYTVGMESLLGCIGQDSIYIKLTSDEIPEFEIYIPNAFSPDGDGVNDVFQVSADESRIYSLQYRIYDRWGGEIFYGDGVSSGWDGRKNGIDCPGGIYIYKIVFSVDGIPGSQERVGVVMLVR